MNKPITVLLVDDHEVVRQGVRAFLEAHPEFAVVGEAGSGTAAVTLAEEHIPDVVLMDLVMPGMDGVETCIEIRKRKELRDTFIAFLTARSEDYSQIAGFEAGADDYIKKPVRMGVLIPRIKAHFRRLGNKSARRRVILTGYIEDEDLPL